MMTTLSFADALDAEVTALQALFPDLAEGLSRAQALVATGGVFPEESGREALVRSQSDPPRHHTVNGTCDCTATQYHPHQPCAHRLAWRLYQRVADRLAADQERSTVDLDAEAVDVPTPVPMIPAAHLLTIQGHPFIKFEGLLELAHARGLVALETTVVQCSPTLAVCQSTARFQDGRTFTDIGDASPDNVAKHVRPHFVRMAATRASARALRRALNVAAVAVEELGEEV